jgi:hypothetical protein
MDEPTRTREQFLNSHITSTNSSPFMTTECPICEEPFSDSEDGCAVTFSDDKTCNHVFCRTCITQWLNTHGVNTCALCRRELFVLDDEEEYEDGDDDDDDDFFDDSEDEERNDQEEDDVENILSNEQIVSILEDIWYKLYWRLEEYRDMVVACRTNYNITTARANDDDNGSRLHQHQHSSESNIHVSYETSTNSNSNSNDDNNNNDNDVWPLDTGVLLEILLDTLAHFAQVSTVIQTTGIFGGMKIVMLELLLRSIMQKLMEYIDITGGIEKVPEFPVHRGVDWSKPLAWVLAPL